MLSKSMARTMSCKNPGLRKPRDPPLSALPMELIVVLLTFVFVALTALFQGVRYIRGRNKRRLEKLERLWEVWGSLLNNHPKNDAQFSAWQLEFAIWKKQAYALKAHENFVEVQSLGRIDWMLNDDHYLMLEESHLLANAIRTMAERLKTEL